MIRLMIKKLQSKPIEEKTKQDVGEPWVMISTYPLIGNSKRLKNKGTNTNKLIMKK